MHHNSTSTYKKRRTAPSHLSVYLASLSFVPKAWKTSLASQNSKTKIGCTQQLPRAPTQSMQAYIWWRWGPTRPVEPRIYQNGQWMSVNGVLQIHFKKRMSKVPKKINGCWTYTTVWSFPDKHDKIFPLTGCHYIHSFCPVCTHLLCRPKAKDEMQLLKRVFCLSHQKASLDNVVVFMWLCKVVIKFRTFEEDHPANTIWGWTCNQMFRTTRNAPLKWWQMVKSRVGMHTQYSVSQPTWDTRLGVKRTGQLESKSAVTESCK